MGDPQRTNGSNLKNNPQNQNDQQRLSKPNLHEVGFQSFVLESASILTKKVVLGWLLPSNKCGTCGASAMTWSKCWRAETQLPALEDSLGTSGE